MTGNPLIAPTRSSREAWTGSGVADSIEGLVETIKTEGRVDDALAGAGAGVEVAAAGAAQIAAAVVKRAGRILTNTTSLITRLTNLTKLLDG